MAMGAHAPWQSWATAAVAGETRALRRSIRLFYGLGDGDEAFEDMAGLLWRQWCDATVDEMPDATVVLITMLALEDCTDTLTRLLLSSAVADTVEDIERLYGVVARSSMREKVDPSTQAVVFRALLKASKCILASLTKECPQSEEPSARTHGPDCVPTPCTINWQVYLQSPAIISSSTLNHSRTGRFVVEMATEVACQQEWYTKVANESTGDQELTRRLDQVVVELENHLNDGSDRSSKRIASPRTSEKMCLQECADEESILRHLFASNQCSDDGLSLSTQEEAHVEEGSVSSTLVEQFYRSAGDCVAVRAELVERLERELDSIVNFDLLSTQVAALLGIQRRSGFSFLSLVSSDSVAEWTRRVQKIFNSLTGQRSDDESQLLALVRLIPFQPSAVVERLIASGVTTSLHHQFLLQILRSCPLLVEWCSDDMNLKPPKLRLGLRRVVLEWAAGESSVESDAVVLAFLVNLSKSQVPGLLPRQLVMDVIVHNIKSVGSDDHSTQSRLWAMVLEILNVSSQEGMRLPNSCTSSITNSAIKQYISVKPSKLGASEMMLRDILLEVVNLLVPTGSQCFEISATAWIQIDIPLLMLLHVLQVEGEFVSRQELTALENFRLMTLMTSTSPQAFNNQLSDVIRCLVWRITWRREEAHQEMTFQTTEDWSLLEWIARHDFSARNGEMLASGKSIIENEVARIILEVGDRGYDRVICTVRDFLLSPVFHRGDEAMLMIIDSSHSNEHSRTFSLADSLQLSRFLVRCWIVAVGTDEDESLSGRHLTFLGRVLSQLSEAIECSQSEGLSLVFLLQHMGIIAGVLTSKTSEKSSNATLFGRLEVMSLRILYLLLQLPGDNKDMTFCRMFTAQVLARSDLDGLKQVTHFLSRAASELT